MAPYSSTLAWKIPWTEEPSGLQSMGSGRIESDTTERLHFDFSLSCIGEGNGNPLQCSCLENPGDGGAWWAALYGVAQSRAQLKRLSPRLNLSLLSLFHSHCVANAILSMNSLPAGAILESWRKNGLLVFPRIASWACVNTADRGLILFWS